MNQELEFNNALKNLGWEYKQLAFYFEAMPGWVSLMKRMIQHWSSQLSYARFLRERNPEQPEPSIKIAQIKEKFGGLRFYITVTGSERFRTACFMIEEFGENMSFDFCMDTGTNQNVTTAPVGNGYWLLTLSDEAREKRLSERLKRIEDDSNK